MSVIYVSYVIEGFTEVAVSVGKMHLILQGREGEKIIPGQVHSLKAQRDKNAHVAGTEDKWTGRVI